MSAPWWFIQVEMYLHNPYYRQLTGILTMSDRHRQIKYKRPFVTGLDIVLPQSRIGTSLCQMHPTRVIPAHSSNSHCWVMIILHKHWNISIFPDNISIILQISFRDKAHVGLRFLLCSHLSRYCPLRSFPAFNKWKLKSGC